MITNALGPLRLIETLQDRVEPAGTIAVMSPGQGIVAKNERGRHEVYRGSKAALNTFMRGYAARRTGGRRTLVLMAGGWVRTERGGPDARLGIYDSIPNGPGWDYRGYAGVWLAHRSGRRRCSHSSWTQPRHALVIVFSGRHARGYTELTGVVSGATPYFGSGESATRCSSGQAKELVDGG